MIISLRKFYNYLMDVRTINEVYFFRGYRYAGLVQFFISLLVLFIVSDYTKYIPIGLPVGSLWLAAGSLIIFIAVSILFGRFEYTIGSGRREANINFELCGKQQEMYDMVKSIDERIKRLEDKK